MFDPNMFVYPWGHSSDEEVNLKGTTSRRTTHYTRYPGAKGFSSTVFLKQHFCTDRPKYWVEETAFNLIVYGVMEKGNQRAEIQSSQQESFKTPVYLKDNGPVQTSRLSLNCLSLVLNASIHYSPFVCEMTHTKPPRRIEQIFARNNRYWERGG